MHEAEKSETLKTTSALATEAAAAARMAAVNCILMVVGGLSGWWRERVGCCLEFRCEV